MTLCALVALELDNLADMLEGQGERRLPKLLDELAGVRLVARGGRQLVMDRQAHVVLMAFTVQRPGQSVTHEIPLAATTAQPLPACCGSIHA